MKKLILLFMLSCTATTSYAQVQATILAATSDVHVGAGIAKSVELAKGYLNAIANDMNLPLELEEVNASNYTKQNCLNAIKNLRDKKRGAGHQKHLKFLVIVSHGVNYENATNVLPYVVMKPYEAKLTDEHDVDLVALKDIFEALKGTADNVHILNETCNNVPVGMINPPKRNALYALNGKPLADLFTSVKSSVMTSSDYKEKSFIATDAQGNFIGGYFMNALGEALIGVQSGAIKPTFKDFFEVVKTKSEQLCSASGVPMQHPLCFIDTVTEQAQAQQQNHQRGIKTNSNLIDKTIKGKYTDAHIDNTRTPTTQKTVSGARFEFKRK